VRSEVRVLPELFLNRLKQIIPSQKFDSIANTLSKTKPTTFRINTLKTTKEKVLEKLNQQGFRLRQVSWYSNAFILLEGRRKELEKTESYLQGEIYIQNLSSMIPPLVLDPKAGECVLDLTAAPGSKTTQIAALMNGEGEIIAVENDRVRFEKLKVNVEIQEAGNVSLILVDGQTVGKKYLEYFDRVLLDAPCSAEGRFLTREPSSYRYWDLSKIQKAAKIQKKLLSSALEALKPGGVLVYSTCTFAPEENEEVLNDALIKFPDLALESVQIKLTNQMAGLISWEGRKFSPEIRKSVRILPTETMEGFFVARIRRRQFLTPVLD